MTRDTPPTIAPLLVSVPEAARFLGGICQKTLWANTCPRGSIPCIRIGQRVMYDVRDLKNWIDHQKTTGGPVDA
jgi:hypothetical protein